MLLLANSCLVSYAQEQRSISLNAADIELGQEYTLPVPNNTIDRKSTIQFFSSTRAIKSHLAVANVWPNRTNSQYVRLLTFKLNEAFDREQPIVMRWTKNTTELPYDGHSPKKEHQLIYPSLTWLKEALLLHPKANNLAIDWYIEPQKKYANYVTDFQLLNKAGVKTDSAAQWLYDRPQAIYQLYMMTGEEKWLKAGKELAKFYMKNLDTNGQFILKKGFDIKYLMPKGLLYHYFLTGSPLAKEKLKTIYKRSLEWNETYSIDRGFWTERNQAAALNIAVSYWELTRSEDALRRIDDIINATIAMTFNPQGQWKLVGCPQHAHRSHEGGQEETPVCSPWMMALLGDALWRFYQLTGDKNAASLIDAFGDFIINHGIYYGSDKRLTSTVLPKYLAAINNSEFDKMSQWTDSEHFCDIAGLLGKSVFIKDKYNRSDFIVTELFNVFTEQCTRNLRGSRKLKAEYWPIRNVRSFGWKFSTTSDLPWLAEKFTP